MHSIVLGCILVILFSLALLYDRVSYIYIAIEPSSFDLQKHLIPVTAQVQLFELFHLRKGRKEIKTVQSILIYTCLIAELGGVCRHVNYLHKNRNHSPIKYKRCLLSQLESQFDVKTCQYVPSWIFIFVFQSSGQKALCGVLCGCSCFSQVRHAVILLFIDSIYGLSHFACLHLE